MFRFENIQYLYGLLLIPFILLVAVLIGQWRKKTLKTFADGALISALLPDLSKHKTALKIGLLCLAFFFLIVGIANPQNGSKLEEIKREGIDLIIALDVSNSMRAEDLSPNRLENAKLAISRLIDNLHDDRIGLVVFAGQAYVQLPITTDYSAAKLFLDNISTDMISTQGTAIGATRW